MIETQEHEDHGLLEAEPGAGPVELFCTICQKPIPAARVKRRAVTCSEEHAIELKNRRRRLRDLTRCRLCNRPSTPEERASFAQWRKETQPQAKRGRPTGKKSEAAGETVLEEVAAD